MNEIEEAGSNSTRRMRPPTASHRPAQYSYVVEGRENKMKVSIDIY